MSNNGGEADQDEDDDLGRERDLLASLIDKLKCEIDNNKNHNKLLESSNKTFVDKLKALPFALSRLAPKSLRRLLHSDSLGGDRQEPVRTSSRVTQRKLV
ncbi:hypothetical protein Tco_1006333 [Tanacetum coccineum]|uniref:Uncharacterized protein n=1 Tax=Tanacetum coccineum TaxID=301880 RepID=A0ABQ5FHL5_9ASTR